MINYDVIFKNYDGSIDKSQCDNEIYLKQRIAEVKTAMSKATKCWVIANSNVESLTDIIESKSFEYIVGITKKDSSESGNYAGISSRNVRLDLQKHYAKTLDENKDLIDAIKERSMWDKILADLSHALRSLGSLLRKAEEKQTRHNQPIKPVIKIQDDKDSEQYDDNLLDDLEIV